MMILRAALTVVLALSLAAEAQQARTMPRIAVLFPAEAANANPSLGPFQQALWDLGYVEGQTVTVDYRYGQGRTEQFPALAAELVQLKPDVMVVGSGPAARAARNATQTIPVVFVGAGDPVGNKLVASMARPGGNVTGLSFAFEDGFAGKWVELLHEAVPTLSRVAFLRHPGTLLAGAFLRDAQAASRARGLTLQPVSVEQPDRLDSAFAVMTRAQAEAVVVDHNPFFHAHHRRIVELAARHRLPAMYGTRDFVDAGGFVSYGVSIPDLWRRSATYVHKILKGAKPADLPVEQPTRFELVINMKTAQALGLTIPHSLLLRADQILE